MATTTSACGHTVPCVNVRAGRPCALVPQEVDTRQATHQAHLQDVLRETDRQRILRQLANTCRSCGTRTDLRECKDWCPAMQGACDCGQQDCGYCMRMIHAGHRY